MRVTAESFLRPQLHVAITAGEKKTVQVGRLAKRKRREQQPERVEIDQRGSRREMNRRYHAGRHCAGYESQGVDKITQFCLLCISTTNSLCSLFSWCGEEFPRKAKPIPHHTREAKEIKKT